MDFMLLSAVSDYNGFYVVVLLSAITINFILLSCCPRLQWILCCCAAVSDYNRFYVVVLLSAITMDFMLLCCCQRLQ